MGNYTGVKFYKVIQINKCEYCGNGGKLLQHHTKYKELHGVDVVIMLCKSCHEKLHNRLHKSGKCDIPPEEIRKYSIRASHESENSKKTRKKYFKENMELIDFNCKADTNITLRETILYNKKSGYVSITSRFVGTHGRKIIYKEVE